MPHIRPIKDLRNTTEISQLCHASREPVFITKNGYGDLVVMSMETYEALIAEIEVDRAIAEAEEDYQKTGELFEAKELFKGLRSKYFGQV